MKGQRLVLSALAVVVLSANVAAAAPARPRQAATVASPQVVLDWNATAVATRSRREVRNRSRRSTSA